MKILAFVDMHGSLGAWSKVEKQAKEADVVVCAGDFTIFDQNDDYFLKKFDSLGKPVIIIPGNHEDEAELSIISSKYQNIIYLHKISYVYEDVLFLGYGGGGFSIVDREFEKLSKEFEKEIIKYFDQKVVLVTHAPPYGTKIDRIMEESCGNKSIRDFIKKNHVDLAISGHLHENAGVEDKIKECMVINPGPYGKMISI